MAFTPELFYGVGALALLAALFWGVRQRRSRNRNNDAAGEAATRESYRHPEDYEQSRKEFTRRVTPS